MHNELSDSPKTQDRQEGTAVAGEQGKSLTEQATSSGAVSGDNGAAEEDPPSGSREEGNQGGRTVASLRRPKYLLFGVVGLVLLLVVGAFSWTQLTTLPKGSAFEYGDRVVSQSDLQGREQALHALYGVTAPKDPAGLNTFHREVAKSMAVSMILDNVALERHIVVPEKQARDILDRYITAQYGDGGRDAFVQSLGNLGTSEPAVLDEIKRQITVGRLMGQVAGKVSVGDAQLRGEFEKRKATLGTPQRRVVRNLVVGSSQDSDAALNDLKSGVPIETVAAQRSRDGSTKQNGGMLGQLARDQIERPVGDAAFSVDQGALYGPVAGKFGWNVGRVDQVLPAAPAQFDQVKDKLRQTVEQEESTRRWQDWLTEQLNDADVKYTPEYQPAQPNAAPAPGAQGMAAGH